MEQWTVETMCGKKSSDQMARKPKQDSRLSLILLHLVLVTWLNIMDCYGPELGHLQKSL